MNFAGDKLLHLLNLPESSSCGCCLLHLCFCSLAMNPGCGQGERHDFCVAGLGPTEQFNVEWNWDQTFNSKRASGPLVSQNTPTTSSNTPLQKTLCNQFIKWWKFTQWLGEFRHNFPTDSSSKVFWRNNGMAIPQIDSWKHGWQLRRTSCSLPLQSEVLQCAVAHILQDHRLGCVFTAFWNAVPPTKHKTFWEQQDENV